MTGEDKPAVQQCFCISSGKRLHQRWQKNAVMRRHHFAHILQWKRADIPDISKSFQVLQHFCGASCFVCIDGQCYFYGYISLLQKPGDVRKALVILMGVVATKEEQL